MTTPTNQPDEGPLETPIEAATRQEVAQDATMAPVVHQRPVAVHVASSHIEGEIVLALLAGEGISAFLSPQTDFITAGNPILGESIAGESIVVSAEDAERSKELISAYQTSPGAPDDDILPAEY